MARTRAIEPKDSVVRRLREKYAIAGIFHDPAALEGKSFYFVPEGKSDIIAGKLISGTFVSKSNSLTFTIDTRWHGCFEVRALNFSIANGSWYIAFKGRMNCLWGTIHF